MAPGVGEPAGDPVSAWQATSPTHTARAFEVIAPLRLARSENRPAWPICSCAVPSPAVIAPPTVAPATGPLSEPSARIHPSRTLTANGTPGATCVGPLSRSTSGR
jgi:hypothetical protein